MPVEFWREVVDRINEELPNTLLLAEAFLADGRLLCKNFGNAPRLQQRIYAYADEGRK